MYKYKHEHSISRMAKVLKVSESGYYKWLNKQTQKSLREIENIKIEKEIVDIYNKSRCVFGIRKITKKLNEKRLNKINHKRVERIMREKGIYSRVSKKFVVTTDSTNTTNPAPNLLKREFNPQIKGKRLVSDTTYISTRQGTLYLAVILDLYGKMPLAISMSTRNNKELVIECFNDMKYRHKIEKGCILHSDRGSTYSSREYQELLKENNVLCSMSKKGDCYDNAAMESFFGKLKTEWIDKQPKTYEEAKQLVYEYVWVFYTKLRPHASNNYLTPYQVYYSKL